MASRGREEVKVVLIDTQYVVTDPLSFKSVVQSLTGKDSCVSWIEESSFAAGAATANKRKREADNCNGKVESCSGKEGFAGGPAVGGGDCKLSKGLSFEDLDRMVLELPPTEEWYHLWSQNNLF